MSGSSLILVGATSGQTGLLGGGYAHDRGRPCPGGGPERLPGWAAASPAQPGVVSDNPADYTPNLLSTSSGRKPHVDALAQRGTTVYAGGLFDLVENSARTAT